MSKVYPSKLFLFGEYVLLDGSAALAIPFEKYTCSLDFGQKDKTLDAFIEHIKDLVLRSEFRNINMISFDKLIEGFSVRSNIAIGYGLGSSGAITAACYDFLRLDKKKVTDLVSIKSHLARIESYFHGKSSGIDPLVSLINKKIHIREDQSIIAVDKNIRIPYFISLIDTQKERNTKDLMYHYKVKREVPAFNQNLQLLKKINRKAVNAFLCENHTQLFEYWSHISDWQWMHFQKMIPQNIKALFESGLRSKEYKLKICGAGGGGYFLVISKKPIKINQLPIISLGHDF